RRRRTPCRRPETSTWPAAGVCSRARPGSLGWTDTASGAVSATTLGWRPRRVLYGDERADPDRLCDESPAGVFYRERVEHAARRVPDLLGARTAQGTWRQCP